MVTFLATRPAMPFDRTREWLATYELVDEHRALFREILRAQSDLDVGFILVEDERVRATNDAFARMMGYPLDELLVLPSYFSLIAPEAHEALRTRLGRRLAGEPTLDHYEVPLIHKDGRRVEAEVAVKRVAERRLLAIVQDISERKHRERGQQILLQTLAQDLRAPLESLRQISALLAASPDLAPSLRDPVATIQASATRVEQVFELYRGLLPQ